MWHEDETSLVWLDEQRQLSHLSPLEALQPCLLNRFRSLHVVLR
jgi:hypothetical protein